MGSQAPIGKTAQRVALYSLHPRVEQRGWAEAPGKGRQDVYFPGEFHPIWPGPCCDMY